MFQAGFGAIPTTFDAAASKSRVFSPHPDAATVHLGSMSMVELVIAFEATLTFHMPTTRCAVPALPTCPTLTLNVQIPAAKATLPGSSTIQPFPFGVVVMDVFT